MAACRPGLTQAPVVRAGALRLAERGCLDGATRAEWKRPRQVAVIIALHANRLATPEARPRAVRAHRWDAPPSRAAPRMAWGRGVAQRWPAGHVPLHAWVMRLWKKKTKRTAPLVLGTTAQERRASGIVRPYEERPAIAQDYAPRQSGGWHLKPRRAPRSRAIVFDVLTGVRSARLSHRCAHTQAGARFADKTRQAIAFAQRRTQRTPMMVDAGGDVAIFETLTFGPDGLAMALNCASTTAHVAVRASRSNTEARMTFPQRRY
jgi:hypothetical protein